MSRQTNLNIALIVWAAAFLKMIAGQNMRVGLGNDIHRLVEGHSLILGGVTIPHPKGLLGHSDGDSLSHAITDALLGAAGLRDIGTHFSDKDPQWKGANSLVFVQRTTKSLLDAGWSIVNVDATILAEKPRMSPFIMQIKTNLSEAMGISPTQVNIKAKTNEGLDAIGKEEAIGAQAVVLLIRKNEPQRNSAVLTVSASGIFTTVALLVIVKVAYSRFQSILNL